MRLRSIIHATLALAAGGAIMAHPGAARAQLAQPVEPLAGQTSGERFVVGDIRIEGLQRISEGTVYNYLPVNIGDEL
ncbi:MAG: hypothetical protein DIU71_03690, partial [Proteobacteria bacterium]